MSETNSDLHEVESWIERRLQEVAPDIEDGCEEDERHGAMMDFLVDWCYDTMSSGDGTLWATLWAPMKAEERTEVICRIVDRYYG